MMKPDEEVIRAFAFTAQSVPAMKHFFTEWATIELRRLPVALNNTGVAQGRCQVLGEITDLFEQAPELAQPKNG
jgi:hypothetical protein